MTDFASDMLSEFTLWMRFMHKTNDDCFADLQNCEKKEKNKMDVWVPPGKFWKKNLKKKMDARARVDFSVCRTMEKEREKKQLKPRVRYTIAGSNVPLFPRGTEWWKIFFLQKYSVWIDNIWI